MSHPFKHLLLKRKYDFWLELTFLTHATAEQYVNLSHNDSDTAAEKWAKVQNTSLKKNYDLFQSQRHSD